MSDFIQAHKDRVTSMVSGWDRLRFRGTVRMLANTEGLGKFLGLAGCLLKGFGKFALQLSRQTREGSLSAVEHAGRPVVHLSDPGVCKQDVAREIAGRDGIKEGLIAGLTAVEPCWSFDIRSNRESGKLELVRRYRKCQHIYHYYQHPVFGFMHVRLQTWLPLNLWVCINGREWLARQMDAAGLRYLRRENCFAWLEDPLRAQELLNQQVSFNWQQGLGGLVSVVNPAFDAIRGKAKMEYYWSLEESEWASDIIFKDQGELTALYGRLLRHGMECLKSPEVMRFLGRRVPEHGVHGNFAGEVLSDLRERPEGVRIKHRVGANSVKMYNKQGTVLRVETTINDPRDMKAPQMDEDGKVLWRRMRKGVSDIDRRAKVSQASNDRYLEAMAAVESPRPLGELTAELADAVVKNGRRARGLNVLGQDAKLLQAVSDGKFILNGFRNKDLQETFFDGAPADLAERRRRSGQVSRWLRLLRAHGLIRKVSGTHRYHVTALAARSSSRSKLRESPTLQNLPPRPELKIVLRLNEVAR